MMKLQTATRRTIHTLYTGFRCTDRFEEHVQALDRKEVLKAVASNGLLAIFEGPLVGSW